MESQSHATTEELVDQIVSLKNLLGQFGRLIEISLALNTTLDQEHILHMILNTAVEILSCETVSIMLYDENSAELHFTASTDSETDRLTRIPVPLDNSIAGMIFTLNSPQIINNLSEDPRHFNLISEEMGIPHQTLVGVPMRLHNKVIGVLEGINKRYGEFTDEDVDILSVIASQAAVAINNARMVASLQAAYQELSQIDKLKSDFIAIASHELRTPLFHILGYAQLLEQDAKGVDAENLKQVVKSAHLLQTLVDDMTNMNLLETRSQQLTRVHVPIQDVIEDAYREALSAFKDKDIETLSNLPRMELMVDADPEKLRQACVNLLNNAARFTPEGGRVEICARQYLGQVHVTIKDNGIGIPPEKLETIFDRLVQADAHTTRAYGGLGLGLPIARGIIELHGGRIWAESEGRNRGATFTFTIPILKVMPFILDEE
ncbi:MAG: HAMP domain-containing histidine kinase [Anaerolineales bacterium]|nr:HAMP domain-containing histidine kinase [Anaerolineales bacterium]